MTSHTTSRVARWKSRFSLRSFNSVWEYYVMSAILFSGPGDGGDASSKPLLVVGESLTSAQIWYVHLMHLYGACA